MKDIRRRYPVLLKVEKKNNDYVIKGFEKYINDNLTKFDLEVSDLKIVWNNSFKYKDLIKFENFEEYLEKQERETDFKIDLEKLKNFKKHYDIHSDSIEEIVNL